MITGAAGAIGRRVVALALADHTVARVIVVDTRAAAPVVGSAIESHRLSLFDPELKALVGAAEVVIHLGAGGDEIGPDGLPAVDVGGRSRGARRRRGRWRAAPRGAVERHGLRRVAQQPRAAHRGGAAAARSRLRLRRPTGRGRAPGGRVASRASQRVGGRAASDGVGRRRVRGVAGAVAVVGPGAAGQRSRARLAVPAPRRPGHRRRPRPPPAPRRRLQRRRPTAGCRPTRWPTWPAPSGASTCRRAGRRACRPCAADWASPARRPDWPTPSTRGWWPTTGCGPPAGSRGCHSDEVYVEADPGGPLAAMSPRRRQEISLAAAGLAVAGSVVGAVLLVAGTGAERR